MDKELGVRFKNIRKFLKMSQEELANILGLTKQAISNIENSKSMPSISTMQKLIADYNINANYLITGIGEVILAKEGGLKSLRESLLKEIDDFFKIRGM